MTTNVEENKCSWCGGDTKICAGCQNVILVHITAGLVHECCCEFTEDQIPEITPIVFKAIWDTEDTWEEITKLGGPNLASWNTSFEQASLTRKRFSRIGGDRNIKIVYPNNSKIEKVLQTLLSSKYNWGHRNAFE